MKNKKICIIVAAASAVLLLLAVVLRLSKKDETRTDAPEGTSGYADEQQPEDDFSPVGTWYSDREQGDTLQLKEDGTFTSDWLSEGTYAADGSTIQLTTVLGKTVSLTIDRGGPCLRYIHTAGEKEDKDHTYFTSLELAKANREQILADKQAEFDRNLAMAMKILTTGTWHYSEVYALKGQEPATHELEITQDTLRAFVGEDREETYTYEVTSISVANGEITMKVNYWPEGSDGENVKQDTFSIFEGEDHYYELTIYTSTFRAYWKKWADISLTAGN